MCLKIHQLVHSGNTTYECKTCHKRFKYLLGLALHEAIQTGNDRHMCPCGKGFTQYHEYYILNSIAALDLHKCYIV